MNRHYINLKGFHKVLYFVGIGGLFTFGLVEWIKVNLFPVLVKVDEMIKTGNVPEHSIGTLEIGILGISLIILLIAPLLDEINIKRLVQSVGLVILLILDVVWVLSAVAQGQFFLSLIFMIWLTSSWMVWISYDIFKILNSWLRVKNKDENQIDMAKLAFIWALVAFVLGRIG